MLSISLSLIAAFTPLIFMDGIVGRLLREFSLTLTFAIVVSTVVSLTITPMICAHYIKEATSDRATWFDRLVEGTLSRIVAFYTRTLRVVLGYPFLTLMVFFATIALTVTLYIKTPKGYFPTDDSGFVIGATRASADISFQAMLKLQQQLADIVMADPAVAGIGSLAGQRGRPRGRRLQPRHHVHQPQAAGGAGRHVDAARDRSPAQEPLYRCPASACSCSRRRTSAPAGGRAIPTINTRCRAPISICCRNGRRSSPSAWRRSRASPTFPATAIPAGCSLR